MFRKIVVTTCLKTQSPCLLREEQEQGAAQASPPTPLPAGSPHRLPPSPAVAKPHSQPHLSQPAVPNQAPLPRCSGPGLLVVPTLQARDPGPSALALPRLQAAASPPHFLPLRPLASRRPGAGSSRAPPAAGSFRQPLASLPPTAWSRTHGGNACVPGLAPQPGLHPGRHAALFSAPVATVLGNALVVVAFAVDRSLRSSGNFFLLSLGVADLLMGECGLGAGGTQAALERGTLRWKVSLESWGDLGHRRPGRSWQPGGPPTSVSSVSAGTSASRWLYIPYVRTGEWKFRKELCKL